ncbi:unnamed protein product [Protopolystoma xenopodis]|uniref:Uncharacterized protein n=1 Tax=Protopolystoma xenopodis TaxID=117903 RepID=A0A448WT64_9PLAT|nr:unnamed protein product [Protopolystoma xenopodis]
MAIHVDPRKHELLEARIQGSVINDKKLTSVVPTGTLGNLSADAPGGTYLQGSELNPIESPDHSVSGGDVEHLSTTNSSEQIRPIYLIPESHIEGSTCISTSNPVHAFFPPNNQYELCEKQSCIGENLPAALLAVHHPVVNSPGQRVDSTYSTLTPAGSLSQQPSFLMMVNVCEPDNTNSRVSTADIQPVPSYVNHFPNPCTHCSNQNLVTRVTSDSSHGIVNNKPSQNTGNELERVLSPGAPITASPVANKSDNPVAKSDSSYPQGRATVVPILENNLSSHGCSSRNNIILKSSAKRKRRGPIFDETQQPRKMQCKDRGTKRIDELFKPFPGMNLPSSDVGVSQKLSPGKIYPPANIALGAANSDSSNEAFVPSLVTVATPDAQIHNQPHSYLPFPYQQQQQKGSSCPQANSPIISNGPPGAPVPIPESPAATPRLQPNPPGVNFPLSRSGSSSPVGHPQPGTLNLALTSGPVSAKMSSIALQTDDELLTPLLSMQNTPLIVSSQTPITSASNCSVFVPPLAPPSLASTAGPSESTDATTPAAGATTVNVETLQRTNAELEHEAQLLRETITKMQEHATKSRDVIRELLIEKVDITIYLFTDFSLIF